LKKPQKIEHEFLQRGLPQGTKTTSNLVVLLLSDTQPRVTLLTLNWKGILRGKSGRSQGI
jgi:hypothetical protein